MFNFDYPKVKHSLARTALQDPYPAWFFDIQGVIRRANLMAFWISGTLKLNEPIKPHALLGRSIFSIFSNSFERIPIEQNTEFYSKKSSMIKRLKNDSNVEASIYDDFIAAMKREPLLEKIYAEAKPYPENEWEHHFIILSPDQEDTPRYLEFQVTIYRLQGDGGFLTMCTPTRTTMPEIEDQYGLLIEAYGNDAYVQLDDQSLDKKESDQIPSKLGTHFRPYYPTLIQDPLWYIIDENKAHQLLVGNSTVGAHFFEMFFAPQLHELMGPVQETSAPRAVTYFNVFTSPFREEEHELHSMYVQTMKRLQQLQDFRDTLGFSQRLNIHLTIPDNVESPFYTCRVILPWAISPDIALQFRSMVRILYRNPLVRTAIHDYQVTLVPENYETEAALILMHLRSLTQEYLEDNPGMTSFSQFVWLLIVMRTIRERLTQEDDEGDSMWEPESAFKRIREVLALEYHEHAEDNVNWIIAEFREIVEDLENRKLVDKDKVLDLLHGFTATVGAMDQVSEFLRSEIEGYNSF